ncbi:hypothetical protein Fmac_006604 [Flemingia macrophylla]|uniref:Uncharacterized protein n=1 Tax=Flemingia macrophylla TaxID=520843 RepID=A0ABD1NB33_9FABA
MWDVADGAGDMISMHSSIEGGEDGLGRRKGALLQGEAQVGAIGVKEEEDLSPRKCARLTIREGQGC